MSKFSDSIKGFINKHFTQEITCANCGKTGKTMFFSTLRDGHKICSSCKHTIPAEFEFKAKETSLDEFKELYTYMQNSINNLEPIFNATDEYSYGSFKVDAIHNLCKIGGSFVFEIEKIMSYDFVFKAEEFKDGIFSPKVKGDVYLTHLLLENPYARFNETTIKRGAKGKAEKRLLSSTVTYQNPAEMDEFLINFGSLVNKFEAEKKEKELQDLVEAKAQELLEKKLQETAASE